MRNEVNHFHASNDSSVKTAAYNAWWESSKKFGSNNSRCLSIRGELESRGQSFQNEPQLPVYNPNTHGIRRGH